MAMYIKVTRRVAEELGLTGVRNRTADGNYLLWQADVARFPGVTVFERASYVGGKAISPSLAKEETDGTSHPVEVHTPERFGGDPLPPAGDSEESETAPGEDQEPQAGAQSVEGALS